MSRKPDQDNGTPRDILPKSKNLSIGMMLNIRDSPAVPTTPPRPLRALSLALYLQPPTLPFRNSYDSLISLPPVGAATVLKEVIPSIGSSGNSPKFHPYSRGSVSSYTSKFTPERSPVGAAALQPHPVLLNSSIASTASSSILTPLAVAPPAAHTVQPFAPPYVGGYMVPAVYPAYPPNYLPTPYMGQPHSAQDLDPLHEKRGRRFRRRYNQIVRKYNCVYPSCTKSYGSLNHLNTHIVTKKHGHRKSKADFQHSQFDEHYDAYPHSEYTSGNYWYGYPQQEQEQDHANQLLYHLHHQKPLHHVRQIPQHPHAQLQQLPHLQHQAGPPPPPPQQHQQPPPHLQHLQQQPHPQQQQQPHIQHQPPIQQQLLLQQPSHVLQQPHLQQQPHPHPHMGQPVYPPGYVYYSGYQPVKNWHPLPNEYNGPGSHSSTPEKASATGLSGTPEKKI